MKNRIDTALLAGASVWCTAILAAPIFSLHGIYDFFALVCHQQPGRSWSLVGQPLPVCIRCTAIYFGFLLALALNRQADVLLLKIAILLTIFEFGIARLFLDSILARAVTGILLGAATAPLVRVGVKEMLGAEPDAL